MANGRAHLGTRYSHGFVHHDLRNQSQTISKTGFKKNPKSACVPDIAGNRTHNHTLQVIQQVRLDD